jgi:hypothetical protein
MGMTIRQTRWTRGIALVAVLTTLAACKGNEAGSGAAGGSTAAAPPRDSVLAQENAILQQQKDSLFGATRSLLAAIASIDSATTQAGVKPPRDKGEPIKAYEDLVRARTVEALQRLRTTQAKLRSTLASVSRLSGQNAEMRAAIDTFRLTVTQLENQVALQTTRGDSLVRALGMATARGDSLQTRTVQLGSTIDSMTTAERKVWWVAGTKDYLMKHSIVAEVGGTRFPFIVKVGATLRPANLHPDTTLFQSFDMLNTRTVPLQPGKQYEVVSSQDLNGADRSNSKGRVFTGPITITDPQKFWAPSHYLVLLET